MPIPYNTSGLVNACMHAPVLLVRNTVARRQVPQMPHGSYGPVIVPVTGRK